MLYVTCQSSLADRLIVEVGAECWGVFRTLEYPSNQAGVYVFKEGWIRKGFLEIWWGEEISDTKLVAPGRYARDSDDCDSHAVTISQTFGAGLRQKKQSWTLIDACPIAWEVREVDANGESLWLTELNVVASQLGAAR